jgi:hypothetical protein
MAINPKNLMKEKVLCGSIEVDGYVDTGAAISAIDPDFLKQTPFAMQKWEGPKIVLADGTTAQPLGGARIYIKHEKGTA